MSKDFINLSRKLTGASTFSGFLSSTKRHPSGKKHPAPKKAAMGVSRGGGHVSAQKIKGVDGLHVNRVNRPINTAVNKAKQVTRGGGHTTAARKTGKIAAVKVSPES